ncbi:MAG: DUF1080 domain-containing protein [Bacteroidota bacterium]
MKSFYLILFSIITFNFTFSQKPEATEVWEPIPKAVQFKNDIPSDAIVLFDGESLEHWTNEDGTAVQWLITNEGALQVKPGSGSIWTKSKFGDCQFHIEWRSPQIVESEGQGRGNSGLFFQKRYEVQILDSYQNRTYSNGQAGSIYKQHIPLVNAMKPVAEWETYDVIFTAPRFNEQGARIKEGSITVLHNGVLIQNHVPIYGTTEYIGPPKNLPHKEDAIMLQDHGNLVEFRNIWIRKL